LPSRGASNLRTTAVRPRGRAKHAGDPSAVGGIAEGQDTLATFRRKNGWPKA